MAKTIEPAGGGGRCRKKNVVYIIVLINKNMSNYQLDYLEQLEAESIHIFREVAGQF
jgi:hypothetical protein